MTLRHRIAHLFGWNYGSVVSWWQEDGNKYVAYIGFQCSVCGEVTGDRMHSSFTLTMNPPIPTEQCCWCGQRRNVPLTYYAQPERHGPHFT